MLSLPLPTLTFAIAKYVVGKIFKNLSKDSILLKYIIDLFLKNNLCQVYLIVGVLDFITAYFAMARNKLLSG